MRTRNDLKQWARIAFTSIPLFVATARAGDVDVGVHIWGFAPASVTIAPHDTVWFTVMDDNGPYCLQSDTGAWTPWYLWDNGDYIGLQFNQTGDYYYRDIFYGNRGVVHVRNGGGNLPPTLTITSPQDGAIMNEPATFNFSVDASDSDNGLMQVDLFLGNDLLQSFYSYPFSVSVGPLGAGTYSLSATAYDFAGATTTRQVSVTVQTSTPPSPATLSQPRLQSGQFWFDASGLVVGRQIVLQSCTDLVVGNWSDLQTTTVSGTTMTLSQPASAGTQFFRLISR